MRISELIMYILAALSAGYGIFVRAAGSGTSFFLVWFAFAVVLILFGISLHIRSGAEESLRGSWCLDLQPLLLWRAV